MSSKIAVLSASWHSEIVESAEASFIKSMGEGDYKLAQVDVIKVPGALEIPLAGKLALSSGYDIAVGIAFVVDGQIYRHEFVGHTVVQSILDVSLETNKPFLSVVLTPQSFNENSDVYEDMYVKHMVEKGREAANSCAQMLDVMAGLSAQSRVA